MTMKKRIVPLLFVLTLVMFPLMKGSLEAREARLRMVSSCLWNTIHDMEIHGDTLFSAYVNGLEILDVASPSEPRVIGAIAIEGGARDLLVRGSYAYIATEKDGIAVCDISDILRPRVVATISVKASEIAEAGGFLFAACGPAGLTICASERPPAATPVATYSPPGYSVDVVRLEGCRAYVTLAHEGEPPVIAIVDVTSPRRPREISRYAPRGGGEGFRDTQGDAFKIYDMAIQGGTLYCAARETGLRLIDVSNQAMPGNETLLPLPYAGDIYGLRVVDDRLFVKSTNGLWLMDIRDPKKPMLISKLSSSGGASLCVKGDFVYMGSRWEGGGLTVIDMHERAHPREVGNLPAFSGIMKVSVARHVAYVAHDYGFAMLDVHDPAAASVIGNFQASFSVIDMDVHSPCVYLVTIENGLAIVDASRPEQPVTIGSYSEKNLFIERVAVMGNRCYLSARLCKPKPDGGCDLGDSCMVVLDVSDPSKPKRLGRMKVPCDFTFIGAWGGRLFAHCPFGGIYAYSPLSGGALRQDGFYRQSHTDQCSFGSDERMAIYQNRIFVAHGDCGLTILDAIDPTHMTLQALVKSPDVMVDVALSRACAYVAELDRGIEMFDVSNSTSPLAMGRFVTPGCALGVFVDGDYVYVADAYSLVVLRREF
jgi:hypothetical protein